MIGKKLQARVDKINEMHGTDIKLCQRMTFYHDPKWTIPVVSETNVYLFGKNIFNVRKAKRQWGSVYGITNGKIYLAIHFGRTVLFINIKKVHRNPFVMKYYLESDPSVTYTRKEIAQHLQEMI